MTEADLSKYVSDYVDQVFSDPTALNKWYIQFLREQIYTFQQHIRYDQANIQRLNKEIRALLDANELASRAKEAV